MYCQAVIGAPGAGKSTYCHALYEYLKEQGREVVVINLDPANDALPYDCYATVGTLISVDDVMQTLHLGPNASLMYCMQYLVDHIDWLKAIMDELAAKSDSNYVLFDFPGQIELYTHHTAVKDLLHILIDQWKYNLVSVHLSDAHYCADPSKFVAVLITALHTMVQLETPHLNILSKMDIAQTFGPLPFSLEYFTEVMDLKYVVDLIQDDPFLQKYKSLASSICQVVEDYSLVNFLPFSVNDQDLVRAVVKAADKANGYCFHQLDAENRIHNMVHPNDNSINDAVQKAGQSYINDQS